MPPRWNFNAHFKSKAATASPVHSAHHYSALWRLGTNKCSALAAICCLDPAFCRVETGHSLQRGHQANSDELKWQTTCPFHRGFCVDCHSGTNSGLGTYTTTRLSFMSASKHQNLHVKVHTKPQAWGASSEEPRKHKLRSCVLWCRVGLQPRAGAQAPTTPVFTFPSRGSRHRVNTVLPVCPLEVTGQWH